MKKRILYVVLATLCFFFEVEGQEKTIQIRPLKIGDKIPDDIWNIPLQVANHPEAKETIKLKDYKGKLIILDFWATWCSSCVRAFPKLEKLQAEYSNQIQFLPITFQNNNSVNLFLQKNAIGKSLKLPILTADSIFSKLFPHKMISHLVWIDQEGTLKATTWSEQATSEHIEQVLEKSTIDWNMKIDMVTFDKNTPLLSFSNAPASTPSKINYSVLMGSLEGVNPVSGVTTDSLNQTKRKYSINATIVTLCVQAWNKPIPESTPKLYLFDKDIGKYTPPNNVKTRDWKRDNTYCYEAVMPDTYSKDQFAKLLAEDLKRYLNVEGHVETRKIKCLVLSPAGKSRKTESVKAMKRVSVTDFVWYLNTKVLSIPYSINHSVFAEKMIPFVPERLQNIRDIQAFLTEHGISAVLQDREVDVFAINEIN